MSSFFFSHRFAQICVHLDPVSILSPQPEVVVHRFPRRHIMRQQTPGTAAARDVEDRIENLTPGMFARPSCSLFFTKVWRNCAPFGIIKVSRVSLSGID